MYPNLLCMKMGDERDIKKVFMYGRDVGIRGEKLNDSDEDASSHTKAKTKTKVHSIRAKRGKKCAVGSLVLY